MDSLHLLCEIFSHSPNLSTHVIRTLLITSNFIIEKLFCVHKLVKLGKQIKQRTVHPRGQGDTQSTRCWWMVHENELRHNRQTSVSFSFTTKISLSSSMGYKGTQTSEPKHRHRYQNLNRYIRAQTYTYTSQLHHRYRHQNLNIDIDIRT